MKTRKKLGQNWNQQFAESSNGGLASAKKDTSGLTVLSASSKQLQLSGNAGTTATANVWKSTLPTKAGELITEDFKEIVDEVVLVPDEEGEEKFETEPTAQPEIIATVVTPNTTNSKDASELLITVAAWDEYGGRGTNKNGKQQLLVETTTTSPPVKEQPPPQQPAVRKSRQQRSRATRNKKLQALKTAAEEPRDAANPPGKQARKLFDPSTGSLVEFAPTGQRGREHHRGNNHHGRAGRHQNRNSKRVNVLKDDGDLKASAKAFSPRPAPSSEEPGLDLDLDALVVAPSATATTNKSSNIFAFGSAGTWGADATPNTTDWSLD